MAFLVEGYNHKKCLKLSFPEKTSFLKILLNGYITPMFFEEIEKYQCLKLSTTQGQDHGTLRRNVAHVTCPQTCLVISQLFCTKSPKTLHD